MKDDSEDQDHEDDAHSQPKMDPTVVYDQDGHWFSKEQGTTSFFGDDAFHEAMLELSHQEFGMTKTNQLKGLLKSGRTRSDGSVRTVYRCTNYNQLCPFQVAVVKDKDCYTITV